MYSSARISEMALLYSVCLSTLEHYKNTNNNLTMAKTLPDQIADLLIALVFIGDLCAGDKLPPERQLAQLLDVDRTSLRMALRILGRMQILTSTQGSGVVITDYRTAAGLDFLDNLYRIPELELGSELLLAGLELFNRALPTALRLALEKRYQHDQDDERITALAQQLFDQAEEGRPASELARLEVALIDQLMAATGNQVLQASAISSHRIRIQLVTRMYELIDVPAHLRRMMGFLLRSASTAPDMDALIDDYQNYIDELTQPLRDDLTCRPTAPRLLRSPLQNGRQIMSLQALLQSDGATKPAPESVR
jgi:DNA-binding FadR family transcriptional regulator